MPEAQPVIAIISCSLVENFDIVEMRELHNSNKENIILVF